MEEGLFNIRGWWVFAVRSIYQLPPAPPPPCAFLIRFEILQVVQARGAVSKPSSKLNPGVLHLFFVESIPNSCKYARPG